MIAHLPCSYSEVQKEKNATIVVEEPRAKQMKILENSEPETITQKKVGIALLLREEMHPVTVHSSFLHAPRVALSVH